MNSGLKSESRQFARFDTTSWSTTIRSSRDGPVHEPCGKHMGRIMNEWLMRRDIETSEGIWSSSCPLETHGLSTAQDSLRCERDFIDYFNWPPLHFDEIDYSAHPRSSRSLDFWLDKGIACLMRCTGMFTFGKREESGVPRGHWVRSFITRIVGLKFQGWRFGPGNDAW